MTHNEQLARLPIYLFLWVAGSDNNISNKEKETFLRLLDKTTWCKSRFLIEIVNQSSQLFNQIWQEYQSGAICIKSLDIHFLLENLKQHYPKSENPLIEYDLLLICEAVSKTEGGFLGVNPISQAEANAIIVIKNLIKETLIEPSSTRADEPSKIDRHIHLDKFCLEDTLSLICIDIINEAKDIHTYRFKEINNRLFDYKAGQFITLQLNIGGKPVSRSYTISSTPTRAGIIELTIKSIDKGLVSNWMRTRMRVGTKISASNAAGEFIFHNERTKKALFISAGSGITPVMSMLRSLYDTQRNMDVVFLNSCRTEKDIVFKDEIKFFTKHMPKLGFHYSLTGKCRKNWKGLTGRINSEMLTNTIPDIHDRHIYLCGPDKFKEAIESALKSIGFDFKHYYYESFGGSTEVVFDTESTESIITFNRSGITSNITSPQSLLESAESAGVSIQSACRVGVCGACKVSVKSGDVISLKNGKKADIQIPVLACSHTCSQDIELDA